MISCLKDLIHLQLPTRRRRSPANIAIHDLPESNREAADIEELCHPPQISAFLHHLPPELRLLIYHYVFIGHVFHLNRLPADRERYSVYVPYARDPQPWIPSRTIVGDHPLFPRPLDGPETPASLVNRTMVERFRERRTVWSLLLTCRQVYNEAIEIFFNASTLRFDDPHVLLDLAAHYISQKHFLAIKRLEILWRCAEHAQLNWDELWRLISEEMQLLSLKVWIILSKRPAVLTQESRWTQSFLRIHGIPRCGIWVWQSHQRQLRGFRDELRERMSRNGNGMIRLPEDD
ncbi:MAG: hypothetical protein Q9216_003497 [Gyalolechia sp. 2 TL-2023]